MKVVWSRAADRDLTQVYNYLESHYSYPAARRFLRRLFKAIDTLAEMPYMGVAEDLDMDKDYRSLVVQHHKVYYYVDEDHIAIVRLWDTRQDPSKFFIPRAGS